LVDYDGNAVAGFLPLSYHWMMVKERAGTMSGQAHGDTPFSPTIIQASSNY